MPTRSPRGRALADNTAFRVFGAVFLLGLTILSVARGMWGLVVLFGAFAALSVAMLIVDRRR